jgi:hypothetical protein
MKNCMWFLGGSLSRTCVQDTMAMWVIDRKMGITTQTSENQSIKELTVE